MQGNSFYSGCGLPLLTPSPVLHPQRRSSLENVLFLFFFLLTPCSRFPLVTSVCIYICKSLAQRSCTLCIAVLIISLIRTVYTNLPNKDYQLVFRLYWYLEEMCNQESTQHFFFNMFISLKEREEKFSWKESDALSSNSTSWFHLFARGSAGTVCGGPRTPAGLPHQLTSVNHLFDCTLNPF